MNSWQISKLLSERNYNIDSETYFQVIDNSPQIDHIKYEPYGNYFEIWTTDNYYWKVGIYRKE